MRNYIKAELYRNFNRVYFWCMTGSIALFALLGNILVKTTSRVPFYYEMVFEVGALCLGLPVYIIIMIIEMVTAEEQKNQTLKNVVSSGISRNKLILSKFIVTFILSVIACGIILIVFFGSGAVLFKAGDGFSLSMVNNFILRLLAATVLWTGTMSVGNLLAIMFKNNVAFAFSYVGLFGILGKIIEILCALVSHKFEYVYNILITTQLKNLGGTGIIASNDLMKAALIGIMYTIIFTIISIVYFKKMEIK